MSKITIRPVCRLCRRAGEKLYLKGAKCESSKSEFLRQLSEKQKAKRIFGLNERQFHNYYKIAVKTKGVTGHEFLKLLEKRIDNVLYRAGIADSRAQARQIVNHGLCLINGKKIKTPSYQVKIGDKFEIKERLKKLKLFEAVKSKKDTSPKWMKVNLQELKGEITAEPSKDDFEKNIQTNLIIEYYSK